MQKTPLNPPPPFPNALGGGGGLSMVSDFFENPPPFWLGVSVAAVGMYLTVVEDQK